MEEERKEEEKNLDAKEILAGGSGLGRRVYLQRSSSKTTGDDIREDNHQRSRAKHPVCMK